MWTLTLFLLGGSSLLPRSCPPGPGCLCRCASGFTWTVRPFSGTFRLRVTGNQFCLVTALGNCQWLSLLYCGPNQSAVRGKNEAGIENEGLKGFSWFTHPWFQMPLMPTCVTTPPPGELLDSYLDSVRCSKVPAVSPHFCSSVHEWGFCYLQAKGQGHGPQLFGPLLPLFIFTHSCSHPTLSYIP